jgi:hypothetical protein
MTFVCYVAIQLLAYGIDMCLFLIVLKYLTIFKKLLTKINQVSLCTM